MIDYLKKFNLPSFPSAISVNISKSTNVSSNGFEWIKSIAEIKKTTGLDVIIGFDVISNPKIQINQINSHIFLGIPNHFNTNNVNQDYIAKKISDFVYFVNPKVNLTIIQPLVEESAKKIISIRETLNAVWYSVMWKFQKIITIFFSFIRIKFIKDAQNMSIDAVQNATDQYTAITIIRQYLEIIFAGIKPKYSFNESLILNNRADTYYLQKVTEYISKNKESNIDLELYIWWDIVEKMMSESMATNKEKNVPRSWYCTQMVEIHMGMTVTFAMFQPKILPKIKKMQNMINVTLFAYTMFTQQFAWMDNDTQHFMLIKIGSVESFVGFPEWIQKNDKLDEFYADLSFNKSTHLINLMNVLKWQMNKKLKSLNSRQNVEWPIKPTDFNASYSLKHNTISDYYF